MLTPEFRKSQFTQAILQGRKIQILVIAKHRETARKQLSAIAPRMAFTCLRGDQPHRFEANEPFIAFCAKYANPNGWTMSH